MAANNRQEALWEVVILNDQLYKILNILPQPAFLMDEGQIVWCNATAEALHLMELPVECIFRQDPTSIKLCDDNSRLQITIELSGQSYSATIQPWEDQLLVIASPMASPAAAAESLPFSDAMRRPLQELVSAANSLFESLSDNRSDRSVSAAAEVNRAIYQLQRLCTHSSESGRLLAENGTAQRRLRNINELLDSFADTCRPLLTSAGYCLRYDPLPAPLQATVDGALLERALYQILANAMTYTPKGGTLHLFCEKQDQQLLIHLEDNGEGIRPEILAGIFSKTKPYASSDPRSGIGLGLPVAKRIAALHGGDLTLVSSSKGTTATLSISLLRAPISLRSMLFHTDPYGGRNPALIELSNVLPANLYNPEEIES